MGFQASMSAHDAEAFRAMVLGGKSVAYLAARFGMRLNAVRMRISRLKLEAPVAQAFEPTYGPTAFVRAETGQCRFPLQARHELPTPTMLVCGQKAPRGHSWCPACARLVYSAAALAKSPALSAYRTTGEQP